MTKYSVHFNGRIACGNQLRKLFKVARVPSVSRNYVATRKEGTALVSINRSGNLRGPRA